MKQVILIYNILIASLFLASGVVGSRQGPQLALGFMFVPVLIYFIRQLLNGSNNPLFGYARSSHSLSTRGPQSSQPIRSIKFSLGTRTTKSTASNPSQTIGRSLITNPASVQADSAIDGEILDDAQVGDINRRLFLKLIGSAGLATFVLTLFTKEAQGAFFGSMPVPGLVGVKDSNGTTIDPAEKNPTDGYEVNDVDDSSSPSYYGFVDKDNNWYITKESSDGSFRYVRGAGSYVANWTARASLAYGYFSNVF